MYAFKRGSDSENKLKAFYKSYSKTIKIDE